MAEKCRTLMEKRIVRLCSWCQEMLKPYKICQNLTKWKFDPPAKFCLELRALHGGTDKLCLNKIMVMESSRIQLWHVG